MGSDQSKSADEERFGSRSSRNRRPEPERHYSEEEVLRALNVQKEQLEREMNDVIRQQAAKAVTSPCTILDRERRPYNYSYTNQPATANLYPNLPVGNQQSGFANPESSYVFVSSNLQGCQASAPPAPPELQPQAKPRSKFPQQPREKAESDDVACPTCKFRYTEKIFNCLAGHASCSYCQTAQLRCGKCNEAITERRNITMEEYVSQVQKRCPCPNAGEGCALSFMQSEMSNHIKECPFSEVLCVLPNNLCRWKGKMSLLGAHFDQFHSSHKTDIGTENFIQLNNYTKTIKLIKIGNYNFIAHLNTTPNRLSIAVQLLGTKVSASKWHYELQFYNKSEPRRKYVFTDKCMSKEERFDQVANTFNCAILPIEYAKTLANNDGNLVYKVYVSKGMGDREKRDESCTRQGRGRGRSRGRGRMNCNN